MGDNTQGKRRNDEKTVRELFLQGHSIQNVKLILPKMSFPQIDSIFRELAEVDLNSRIAIRKAQVVLMWEDIEKKIAKEQTNRKAGIWSNTLSKELDIQIEKYASFNVYENLT